MADTVARTVRGARGREGADTFGGQRPGTRHPLVAVAMAMPVAALLAVAFGGWEAVVIQASSVAEVLGR
ncbi:hypothetical protein [Streptomyces palmae]|uniref:Uncharacterized protein n=1 Tax=Streptomyces palmae TaxID=1701085 RepID=A0A4Z0G547_9ACTN|nr:hypothetical protein [Streptomyces palmae]TGA89940.1 hypothetical protein E4099_28945 [Streptomyces palmae]